MTRFDRRPLAIALSSLLLGGSAWVGCGSNDSTGTASTSTQASMPSTTSTTETTTQASHSGADQRPESKPGGGGSAAAGRAGDQPAARTPSEAPQPNAQVSQAVADQFSQLRDLRERMIKAMQKGDTRRAEHLRERLRNQGEEFLGELRQQFQDEHPQFGPDGAFGGAGGGSQGSNHMP